MCFPAKCSFFLANDGEVDDTSVCALSGLLLLEIFLLEDGDEEGEMKRERARLIFLSEDCESEGE